MENQQKTTAEMIKNALKSKFWIFLAGTFLMWLFINLSKTYNQNVWMKVKYNHIPHNLYLQEDPPKKLLFHVQYTGFKLVKTYISVPTIELSLVNVQKVPNKKYDYFITSSEIVKQAKKEQNLTLGIKEFQNAYLYFKLGKNIAKKIPVKPFIQLQYDFGYKAFGKIKLSPDSIWVSGPQFQVNQLHRLSLKPLILKGVRSSINQDIAIEIPRLDKLHFQTNKVNVKVNVQKITENTVEIPVKVINVPFDAEVITYPKKVVLHYQIKLADFNKVHKEEFTIVCDYLKKEDKYLVAQIVKTPPYVMNAFLEAEKIEYLILK